MLNRTAEHYRAMVPRGADDPATAYTTVRSDNFAAGEFGVAIPRNMAVIGFDDILLCGCQTRRWPWRIGISNAARACWSICCRAA